MFFGFFSFIFSKIIFFCSAIKGSTFPKPLSSEEEKKYLTLYKEQGDAHAKEMLISHNLRLVAHIVKKYQGAEDTDDLISVGTVGLIKAINTYSPDKGTLLATYTARCIENEILMLLRSNKKYAGTVYLNDVVGRDKDGNELSLIDLLSDDGESVIEGVERDIFLEKVKAIIEECLDEREYKIMVLRYGLKNGVAMAQREVASLLKISRSYVSRLEKTAFAKIRKALKEKKVSLE